MDALDDIEEVGKDSSETINNDMKDIYSIVKKKWGIGSAGQVERIHRSILSMGNTFSKDRE